MLLNCMLMHSALYLLLFGLCITLYRMFDCSLCFVVLFFSNTYRKWKWNYQIWSCFASSFAAWKQCTVNLWRNWILSSYHISLGNWGIWHSCLCFPLGVLTSKTRWQAGQSRMNIFLLYNKNNLWNWVIPQKAWA